MLCQNQGSGKQSCSRSAGYEKQRGYHLHLLPGRMQHLYRATNCLPAFSFSGGRGDVIQWRYAAFHQLQSYLPGHGKGKECGQKEAGEDGSRSVPAEDSRYSAAYPEAGRFGSNIGPGQDIQNSARKTGPKKDGLSSPIC